MKFSPSRWPSPGFLVVCVTYVLVVVFFAWGFSTPDLDRVWTLYHELKTGKRKKLRSGNRVMLEKCMSRHSALATELLDGKKIGILSAHSDGWIATPTVTIVRTEKAGNYRRLNLDIQTPRDLLPYRISVRGRGWKKSIEVTAQGLQGIDLPEPPKSPEVIEVRLVGKSFEPDPSILGVRVSFEGKP